MDKNLIYSASFKAGCVCDAPFGEKPASETKEYCHVEQIRTPLDHVWLSVLVSLIPLIALLFMLAALRMTAWLPPSLVIMIRVVRLAQILSDHGSPNWMRQYLAGASDRRHKDGGSQAVCAGLPA